MLFSHGVSSRDRVMSRAAVIGLVVMAMSLTACGRRAALDPPPEAAALAATQSVPAGDDPTPQDLPPEKPFVLDPLL